MLWIWAYKGPHLISVVRSRVSAAGRVSVRSIIRRLAGISATASWILSILQQQSNCSCVLDCTISTELGFVPFSTLYCVQYFGVHTRGYFVSLSSCLKCLQVSDHPLSSSVHQCAALPAPVRLLPLAIISNNQTKDVGPNTTNCSLLKGRSLCRRKASWKRSLKSGNGNKSNKLLTAS